METNNNNLVETQGEETKTKGSSKSQVVKSFGNNCKKLIELGLVNEADGKKLKELHKKVVTQFLGLDLFE